MYTFASPPLETSLPGFWGCVTAWLGEESWECTGVIPGVLQLSLGFLQHALGSHEQRNGRCSWGYLPRAPRGTWAQHRLRAHSWTRTQKKAPWESRSKQCDCISRLIQLIPEARVNSLIQCIIPVQADPRAGIVSRGALLQHAASATLCPRAWLQTALLLSTSFREMLRTNFEGQNSGCFRPFRAFIPLPLPALLDLWSTLLTFKYSKGQISSDLASISRALIFANTSLSAYPLSPLFSIRQLLITTGARQLVDGTIILTRTFKSRLLTHRVQHGAAARALSSSCPFPTAAAEQLSWWSLATLLGQEEKTTFFLDIII